jgi:hypothetical protein
MFCGRVTIQRLIRMEDGMSGDVPARPHGQRFSHVYLQSGDLLQDSERARLRVAELMDSIRDLEGISAQIRGELGVEPFLGYEGIHWPNTIKNFEPQDFLDLFTVACRFLTKKRQSSRGVYDPSAKQRLLSEANRIFVEERLCYELDSGGGVHFRVDADFAAATNAAIAALGDSRYANAREQFEAAMAALSKATIDGKQGVRGVFNATECVFKLMYKQPPRLARGEVSTYLKPTVKTVHAADPTALKAAVKSLEAFGVWVDACQNDRHEQGVEEPSQPPLDLAVQLISVGSGYLRWLISIDQKLKDPATTPPGS